MRVLILGGKGMLGHKAWQVLKDSFDVYVTIRGSFSEVEEFGIFDKSKTICNVNVLDFPNLEEEIGEFRPDVILNCIGIVKQISEAHDAVKSIEINSLFPHKLALLCSKINSRLIHISTDCVFSGKKGGYTEDDNPDPLDLYGRTKLLGEVTEGNVLTLRTSIIGRELNTIHGLLEWFFSQRGKTIKGYTKAIFSGFTTGTLSAILKDIILNHKSIKGLYHVSSGSISKFDLLMSIKKKFDLNVEIIPDDQFKCDRSLDSSKFRIEAGYIPPLWDTMIRELAEEIEKEAI
ncbi:MAG: SDR family oxidoreductase [Candidatus Omnitrophica bacterium]|nr:SDR family oxidoreductase [Candidatus Omnitrophota bacterium]